MKKLLTLGLLATLLTSCGNSTPTQLTRTALEESLELGTQFLLANQKVTGNFNYSYNFETGELSEDDNQVRQAGALWGLTLLYAHQPSDELEAAIVKGLAFYGSKPFPEYPGDEKGKTGSLALLCLSLLDFLSVEETPNRDIYEAQLEVWLDSLISLENKQKSFYGAYDYDTGLGKSSNSPYSDGEALLAISKAANYFDDPELFVIADESLDALWEDHVTEALEENPDPDDTKGFYQWVTMSLYELDSYQRAHGEENDKYAEKAIELAYWMIDVHKTLERTRNTAYAYEGIIAAYHLAELYGEDRAMDKFLEVIDSGLSTLTSWQVGHSLQVPYLIDKATGDTLALGGVTNAADEADLRIDVTQHQMHAVLMALEWVYE